MGLTKRKDSYYVGFPVLDDGEALRLASGGGGQLKRWKAGSFSKTVAKQQQAILKTKLLSGQISSPTKEKADSVTVQQCSRQYLDLEQVKKLKSYRMRRDHVRNLVSFFTTSRLGQSHRRTCASTGSSV